MYFSVKAKYVVALLFSLSWMGFSFCYSLPWFSDLTNELGIFPAYFIITFIAIIPGFMNAFVAMALLLDRRPKVIVDQRYPPVTARSNAFSGGPPSEARCSGDCPSDRPA